MIPISCHFKFFASPFRSLLRLSCALSFKHKSLCCFHSSCLGYERVMCRAVDGLVNFNTEKRTTAHLWHIEMHKESKYYLSVHIEFFAAHKYTTTFAAAEAIVQDALPHSFTYQKRFFRSYWSPCSAWSVTAGWSKGEFKACFFYSYDFSQLYTSNGKRCLCNFFRCIGKINSMGSRILCKGVHKELIRRTYSFGQPMEWGHGIFQRKYWSSFRIQNLKQVIYIETPCMRVLSL